MVDLLIQFAVYWCRNDDAKWQEYSQETKDEMTNNLKTVAFLINRDLFLYSKAKEVPS